jgi:RsiW-degrading membrane proteinase PrsW (M82 family)
MADQLNSTENVIPARLKRIIKAAGIILLFVGIPPALNLFCIVPFSLIDGSADTPVYILVSLMLVTVTLAAGGAVFYHANRSLNGKPSRPMRLPSMFLLMDVFLFLLLLGIFMGSVEAVRRVFIPPLLYLAAALPPLWAISWFLKQKENGQIHLTWRRGMTAFAGGVSISLFIAIVLETLLTLVIQILGFNLLDAVAENMDTFLYVLGRSRWAAVMTSPGFIYVFLQFTLIAPLVEELAKPLVVLPILRNLNRRETFLIGAIAGAGFAMLENGIYATIGISLWIEFLFVRALGSAIQPLGSGLVALGWREILRGEPGAWGSWARRFGIVVVMHALWNAGSLLVVVLGGAFISGNLPREVGLPGIAATGYLFIALILLGLSAQWLGRKFALGEIAAFSLETGEAGAASTNQMIAIWAVACLITILPAGIIISRLWLR